MSLGKIIVELRTYRNVRPEYLARRMKMRLTEYFALERSGDRPELNSDQRDVLTEELGIPKRTLDLMLYSSDIPIFDKLVIRWQAAYTKNFVADIHALAKVKKRALAREAKMLRLAAAGD